MRASNPFWLKRRLSDQLLCLDLFAVCFYSNVIAFAAVSVEDERRTESGNAIAPLDHETLGHTMPLDPEEMDTYKCLR